MTIETLLQQFTNGIMLGSIYALVAIGYTIVYGIVRLINFAHGSIFMMGMYVVFLCMSALYLPWYVTFLICIAFTALIGACSNVLAYQRLRNRNAPASTVKIASIGVGYLIENLFIVIFSGVPRVYPSIPLFTDTIQLGAVRLQRMALIVPLLDVALMLGLMYLLKRTKPGMAMRAVCRDVKASQLMGVDVNRIITFAFALGSGLAAIGSFLWGLRYPYITPTVGGLPGMKSFIAAVVGGIGNIEGAVLGGLLLGVLEVMITALFPALTTYRDALAFGLLIVILLIKPTGIIGEKTGNKI